jgi:hypothetical protein
VGLLVKHTKEFKKSQRTCGVHFADKVYDFGEGGPGQGGKMDGDGEYMTKGEKRYVDRILQRGQGQIQGASQPMEEEYPQQSHPGDMGYGYRDSDQMGEQFYPGMNIHNHHYSQEQAQLMLSQQNEHITPSKLLAANMQRQSQRSKIDDAESSENNLMRNQGACIYDTFSPSFNQMTMQRPDSKTYNGQYRKSKDHMRKNTNKAQQRRHQQAQDTDENHQHQNQNFDGNFLHF